MVDRKKEDEQCCHNFHQDACFFGFGHYQFYEIKLIYKLFFLVRFGVPMLNNKRDDSLEDKLEKGEILEDYIGYLAVIIALALTIAWDSLKATINWEEEFALNAFNSFEFLLAFFMLLNYASGLFALGMVALYYRYKFNDEIEKAKNLASFFFRFAPYVIILGFLPLINLGETAAILLILIFVGIIPFFLIMIWRGEFQEENSRE